jgi:hypothetical protein
MKRAEVRRKGRRDELEKGFKKRQFKEGAQ